MRAESTGLLAFCLALTGWAALPAAAGVDAEYRARLDRLESLFRQGRFAETAVRADSLIAVGIERANPELEMLARLHAASARAMSGEGLLARTLATRALDLARELGDSSRARMASRWVAYSLLATGSSEEATAEYLRLERRSAQASDDRELAYSQFGLAFLAYRGGETAEALDRYERAALLFAGVGEVALELDARIGQARALGRLRRTEEMTSLYSEILARAEATGERRAMSAALNNLGAREYQVGDPGLAVEYWRRSLALLGPEASLTLRATPTSNVALALMEMGAFTEAVELLDGLAATCDGPQAPGECAAIQVLLANSEAARGRRRHAELHYRRALELSRGDVEVATDASVRLARSLLRRDDLDGAREALAIALPVEVALPDPWRLDVATVRCELALASSDLTTAAIHARDAATTARRLASPASLVAALVQSARVHLLSGQVPTARAELEEARASWEDLRALPRDPQWRERRGVLGADLHFLLARAILAEGEPSEASEAAFVVLQNLKTRTLLERMAGPDAQDRAFGGGAPEVDLKTFREAVLRPNEWFVDFHVHPETTLAFVVGPSSLEIVELPGEPALRGWARSIHDIFGRGVHVHEFSAEQRRSAARRLHDLVLAPVLALVPDEASVVLSADGPLNALPLGAWIDEFTGRRATFRVPSAAVLSALRSRPSSPRGDRDAIRVLEGALLDADGRRRRPEEAQWLRRRFSSAVSTGGADSPGEVADLLGAGAPVVLHVAAHSEAFDQRPWRSRIVLGPAPGEWLEAGAIASARTELELAVLAGCSTAGGRYLSGEGVLGLATAFLSGGARVVVASLWPVEDRTTARLMSEFYLRLEKGLSVAAALDGARHAVLASDPSADASLLAGFVVVGNGTREVVLRPRPYPWTIASAVLAGAIGLLGLVWALRRGRRVIPSAEGSPR